MNSIKDLLEPVKVFNQAKETHHQNVEEYFDKLVKDTNTNADENKQTVIDYNKKLGEIADAQKYLKKVKRKKGWLRFLEVLCYILIILIPVGILIHKHIKNKIDVDINDTNKRHERLNGEANELKAKAYGQLHALFNSFDWNTSGYLINQTLPLFNFDPIFDPKRYQYLHDNCGLKEDESNDTSTLYVQSGTILGNPFLFVQDYVEEMVPKTYHGELVITWTTTTYNNGRTETHHHTQTLHAHVTKPAPEYYKKNYLIYGNDAAPSLSFSRTPSGANGMSEKQIAKMVKKEDKRLDKIAKKDMSFTKMGNTEFDTLFGAENRDNEVEFRVLFTPLAQANMISLIKSKQPYGDDFNIVKKGKLNYVLTNHSQGADYSSDPDRYYDYDLENMRKTFIEYNDAYFQSFYFDFAPLISIPIYQQHKAREYIYKDNYRGNNTSYEIESIANKYNEELFASPLSVTHSILKNRFISKTQDGGDLVEIAAYGFKTIPHIDYVPVMGGDGYMHDVPVHWDEYVQVVKKTPFEVKPSKLNRFDYLSQTENNSPNMNLKNVYYQKGLIANLK